MGSRILHGDYIRRTSITYPDGTFVEYNYGGSNTADDVLKRLLAPPAGRNNT